MPLGLDFLAKHHASINLGSSPSLQLSHSSGKTASVPFIKAMPKPKPCTHVASLKEIEIPPYSFYYADAYLANLECADEEGVAGKVFGITAIQKENEFFDPGFILRDAVITPGAKSFKVELANPSEFPLKIEEDTPLGVIFDYDCEILETNGAEKSVWNSRSESESEEFLRRQALLTADVELTSIEVEDLAELNQTGAPSFWTKGPIHSPKSQDGGVEGCCSQSPNHSTDPLTTQPQSWLSGSVKKKDEFIFTVAYSDHPDKKLLYTDIHGKDKTQKERMYMVDMDDAEYTPEQREQLEKVLEDNAEAFSRNDRETGCTDVICHHVKITNPRPVYLSYHKAQGADIRKEIDEQTNSMLADGIVIESESPYCCPIVMVRKKYGGWRYCVDLRRINQMTEKVTFPMPHIEDALRKLKRPKYFSSMDLLKAYYQIPVAEEDQKFYAFSDGKRHLQFTRCPMGAKNSGSTLAMLMELVLRGLPPECVIGYLDDILLATEDWDTHLVLLDKLLKSIIKAKLKLCPIKCQFARLETKTLGHVLSKDGIRPDRHNLDKIQEWTEAKNVAEVRTFLGLTGYYRSLIRNYAHIAAPLTDLLHKDKEWKWGDEEKQAFHRLKQALMTQPIAAYPDYDLDFQLHTDASKVALGAVLAQEQDKKERMIACMSKKFTTEELKWAPYDREFLAMVLPTRHFSHYLRWKPFKLFTDHKPLLAWKDVTTQKDGSGKRTRWVMELSTYDVEVIYKEGKRHGNADALSRHPCPDEASPEMEEEVLSALSDGFGKRLQGEKTRIAHMVRELSKFNVQVIYQEKGRNRNEESPASSSTALEEGICSLTTVDEIELNFIAAQTYMEVALVEIHADEATEKEMRNAQDQDPDIARALALLKSGSKGKEEWADLPSWYQQNKDKFVVSKNILYHVKTINSSLEPVARTVIPKSKVKEMLFRCHGCMQSGHPGHARAIARMERFAVWPGMVADIKDHVKRCAECQAAREGVPKRMAPVQVQKAIAPLQFIQADLFKTGAAHNGMQYICVFEDRYTKLCRLYALKDAKARSVAKCIESFVSELGCPDTWGTDGGPEFYSTLTMAICHVFQVKKEFALAYRPQTQGQTERKNRTLKAELIKRISQFGKDWPSYLKWIEMAYNSTPHPSHGFTPFILMFGREAKLPMQFDIPKIDTTGWKTTMKSYLRDFLDRMAVFRKQAILNRTTYQMKMAQAHDSKLLDPLKPGTKVLRDVPGQFRGKLDLPRDGPWEVEEQRVKEGRVLPVYRIKNERGNIVLAHRENLNPFLEPNFNMQREPDFKMQKDPKGEEMEEETPPAEDEGGPATRTRSKRGNLLTLYKKGNRSAVSNSDALEGAALNDANLDGADQSAVSNSDALEGAAPNGANPDDVEPNGANPDDVASDGANPDDVESDGANPDNDDSNGDDPNGDDSNGDDSNGDDSNGDNSDGGSSNGDDPDAFCGDIPGDDDQNGDIPGDSLVIEPSFENSYNDEAYDGDPSNVETSTDELPEIPESASNARDSEESATPENTISGDQSTSEGGTTPENTIAESQSAASSNYATPESLDNTAIEMILIREGERASTSSQEGCVAAASAERPLTISISSTEPIDGSLSDVFAPFCSEDERMPRNQRRVQPDWGTPESAQLDERLREIVSTSDGDCVGIRRSSRLRSSTKQ